MAFNYTVDSNDKGLTYIFLEQAKKQAGFDSSKKINWNSVMSVFDRIQEQELAEGEQLFSGGTDKTRSGWGNSYILKKGDKINLSNEQMNMIYEAMGVNISATKTKNTPANSTTPPVTKAGDIPAKDTNPPQAEHSVLLWDKQSPQNASKTVKTNNGFIEYDFDGYPSRFFDENKNCTRKICSRNSDGTVDYYYDNEYDSKGNNTRWVIRNSDGTVFSYCDFEYDSKGNRTRRVDRKPDGTVNYYYFDYEYDSKGNETRCVIRNSDGTVRKVIER